MPELIEYEPGTHFPEVIGGTLDESSPAWPKPTRTGKGAPNVIFFILDDVGYGQMSVFGGLCETLNLEQLANGACATSTTSLWPAETCLTPCLTSLEFSG
ncbi:MULTISPECIES: hypothetical protein [unclassified Methanosarcina]|nr:MULTISPECIES: hypothetical protein [unclassified Methanosarcina]